jgi:small subunit ribosomal protein S20
MANIKSAVKRMRQTARRAARNRSVRSALRTTLKTYRAADDSGKSAKVPATYSEIDTARRKGVIHRNAAARYKSRLARRAAKAKSRT